MMEKESAPSLGRGVEGPPEQSRRDRTLLCRKYDLHCRSEGCVCPHPETYCKFRTQCLIHSLSVDRARD